MIEKDEEMKEVVLQNILEKYNRKKAKLKHVIREAIMYKSKILEFKEPDSEDMFDVGEHEEILDDSLLLKMYNKCLESDSSPTCIETELYINDNDVIKFEFKGKETIVAFSKKLVVDRHNFHHIYDVMFWVKVPNKKRLHIQASSIWTKKTAYETCFIDYEKKLDKYDLENDEKLKKFFSDKLYEWKNKKELNSEKYILSNSEKEFLLQIFVTYDFPYSLVLKDGILCIHSSFNTAIFYKDNVKKISYFIDFMIKILERFMNI